MLGPGLAVLTGCLIVVSTAPFHLPLASWLAFAPLLIVMRSATTSAAAALGALAGSVLFVGVGRGVAGYDASLAAVLPVVGAAVFALYSLATRQALAHERRSIRVFGPAVLWAALECLLSSQPVALPATPGLALIDSPAGRLASVVGIHGLSFLMVASGAALAEAQRVLATASSTRQRAYAGFAGVAPALLAVVAGSLLGGEMDSPAARRISFHAVQPTIPFSRAAESWWVPAYRRAIHARFASALGAASDTSADLFLWPEGGAMLGDIGAGITTGQAAGPSVRLVNAIDLAPDGRRRNRVFALDGAAAPQIYEKRWLVPIAERGYQRGEAQPVFDTRAGRVGSLICFEVCFSAPARERVEQGAELLFASTNDGAFGTTALALLHRDHARARAVETGRPVLFISNDGPSAHIDRHGRVVREIPMGEAGVLEGQLALAAETTVHQRIAPAIAPLLWMGALLVLVAPRRRVAAPRRIARSAWGIGVALAIVATLGLLFLSDALVRRAARPADGHGNDALALAPNAAIADAVGPANEVPERTLAYLASHFGAPRDAREVGARLSEASTATDALALSEAARALGFEASVAVLDYAAIRSLLPPFVTPLAGSRLLVVMEVTRSGVRAFDPARGFVSLSRERFELAWSGTVVTIRPAPEEGPRRSRVDHVATVANK